MPDNLQFAACKFRSTDTRLYTYHWDGEPLVVGDIVKVEDRSGDGWKRVEVAAIVAQPPFTTKPIIGKVPASDEPAGIADQ